MPLTPEEINIQHDGTIGEDEDTFVYPELVLDEVTISREGDIIFIEDNLNDLETVTLNITEAHKLREWLEEHT